MDDFTLATILNQINEHNNEENLIVQLNCLANLIDRDEFTLTDMQIK